MKLGRASLRLFPSALGRWSFLRKLRNPFAGLAFFTRCSDGGLNIVSRHWPHHLCWSWLIDFRWQPPSKWRIGGYTNSGGSFHCVGPFALRRQNYDYMTALGRHADDAISFIERELRAPNPHQSIRSSK